MKRQITSIIALIGAFVLLVGCVTFKPQDIIHNTVETSYHYWHNARNHERGIKYNIIIKGERLNVITAESIVVNGKTLPVEIKLIEPLDRDEVSTLIITALYKEKKGKKETEFKKLPDSLFGKEPFKNAILNYSVRGKDNQVDIKEFEFKPKG